MSFICCESVNIYQLSDFIAIGATSVKDAVGFYREIGMNEEFLYKMDSIKPADLMLEIPISDSTGIHFTIKELIEEEWQGQPFIAFSED